MARKKIQYSIIEQIQLRLPKEIIVNAIDFLKTNEQDNSVIKDENGNVVVTDEKVDKLLNEKTNELFLSFCNDNTIPSNTTQDEKLFYKNEILSILEKRLLVM